MRLEAAARADQCHVWMTDADLEGLRRAAANHRDDLILQLGGYVGLPAFEIPQIEPRHVKWTGAGGKPRDTYLPRDVEAAIHRYQTAEKIAQDEPLIDLTERGVRAVVKRTAEQAAEETGDPDFRHVSSHDLRRRFTQRLLVDERVNPRVVMAVGVSMIALDTSFLIDYLRGIDAAGSFLEQRGEPMYYVPAISLFEVYRDAAWSDSESVKEVAAGLDWAELLPFDVDATQEAAEIHAELLAAGTPINAADVMIAGVCRRHGAALVTRDGDFKAVDELETITY